MSDSVWSRESSPEPSPWDKPPLDEPPPQFGAVDIVEAFTAMRHEWRGQTKESLAIAEQIEAAVTSLQSLEARLLAQADSNRAEDSDQSKRLVQLIADADHQLSRAIAAVAQWEANRRLREAAEMKAAERYFAGMNVVARWFARPLLAFVAEQRPPQESSVPDPVIEGLNLVLARLRRGMTDHQIERIDVEGQEFDAEIMHAIGTVASTEHPSGHVAEQLSPAYRWQGRILRFADVRIAK